MENEMAAAAPSEQSKPSRSPDVFEVLSAAVQARMSGFMSSNVPLFTTDAEQLYEQYLAELPFEQRQIHACHACRHFIEKYGGLVTVNDSGATTTVLWDGDGAPELYRPAVQAMARTVSKASITGVFVSSEKVWGRPVTGQFKHFGIEPQTAYVWSSLVKSAYQAAAEKGQDFPMVMAAIQEFPLPAVEQAVTVLTAEALYRSEKCLGVAQWFE